MKTANKTPIPGPANVNNDTIRPSIYSRPDEIFETYVVLPPDNCYGWLVVLASFLCLFIADGCIYTFGIFLKDMSESFNCSESRITLSSSIQNGCYNLSGPIICALLNRFGFRGVCITGAIVTSIAFFATSFVETLPMLIFLHGFLAGIGFGLLYMPSIIIVGFYFEKWRALATAIIVTGSAISTIAFPPLFNIVLREYNWRNKFRVISGFALFLVLCGATYRPIKQTRVVQQQQLQSEVFTRLPLYSIGSTMASMVTVKRVFSRNHNLAYPTTAEVVRQQGPFSLYGSSSSEMAFMPSMESMRTVRTHLSVFSRMPTTESERLETLLEDPEGLTKCQICCMKCKLNCTNKCCHRRLNTPFRPMYRDDVFLAHSTAAVSHYAKTHRDRKDYHMSMTRVMTQRDFEEEYIPCLCCPESIRRTLATMFDISIIRSPPFVTLLISAFMYALGVYIPYLYLIDAAKEEGHMQEETAISLMIVLGIANTIGRLACGLLIFCPKIRPAEVSSIALLAAGAVVAFSTLSYNITWQFIYVSTYGLGLAIINATRPLIIIELVGLDHLSNAFGLQAIFQGVACLTGIPIAGLLYDLTHIYLYPYCFAATCMIISALLLVVVHILTIRKESML